MKRNLLTLALLLLIATGSANAQGILDKIDRTVDKIDRASNTADRAAEKSEKAGKLGKKIGGLFGKGKSGEDRLGVTTKVMISGISLENLQAIDSKLNEQKGVLKSEAKFGKSGSVLTVSHSLEEKELLDRIIQSSSGLITKGSVESLVDGEIKIKIE